jgi:hypothetical protein
MRTGLKFALLLPLFALMAPTGGFPSRPNFQKVVISSTTTPQLVVSGGTVQGSAQITSTASAVDETLRFDTPSLDAFYLGSNHSGVTNAIGAANNTEYIFTNQANCINLGTSSTVRLSTCVGVQVGTPTGGDCGAGCLNAQTAKLNNVSLFAPIAAVLAADSTKSSTITQALDATLQFTLPAGTYAIELNGAIAPAGIAAAAGGFAGCLQAAGTIPTSSAGTYSAALFVTNVAFSTQWFQAQTISSSCTGGSQIIYTSQTAPGTSFDQVVWRGVLTTTTSGTFGLSWAQSSSSATATTLKQGMTLTATRVL